MSTRNLVRSIIATVVLVTGTGIAHTGSADEATVIELTQTGCQFLEPENGVDHGFQPTRKADCVDINARTGSDRLAKAQLLHLEPGRYIFRVTNTNVPYELGFWLRGAGLVGRATLPSVSGGGLVMGASEDYAVELVEGEYLYSCPLNPTPDYRLVVEG